MKFSFLVAFLLYSVAAFTQNNGILSFDKKEIHLKDLKADNVPTTVIFTFKNTGDQPLIITRISPVSNLLGVKWDKTPVLPGTSSAITVFFSSNQMPENFNYSILVYSNAQNNKEELNLKANIIDNPDKLELLYKYNMDGIKFKTDIISFEKVYTYQKISDTLYFYNSREDSAAIGTSYIPSSLSVKIQPPKIASGKTGMIVITFDAVKKNDYGYVYEYVLLTINGNRNNPVSRITVTANITEDFSKLTKQQLANAPVVSFDKKEAGFGTIASGSKVDCHFSIKNNGKSNLIIRKIKAGCGCTTVNIGETSLAPGHASTIQATFDSSGRSGRQYKTITVITNDPKTPEEILTISGDVK